MRHLLLPSNANPWSQCLSQPGGERNSEECNDKREKSEDEKDGADDPVRSLQITLRPEAHDKWDENARERTRRNQLINNVRHLEGCEVRVKSSVSTERTKEDDQPHPAQQT